MIYIARIISPVNYDKNAIYLTNATLLILIKQAPPIRAGDTWKRGGNWDSEYYKKGN